MIKVARCKFCYCDLVLRKDASLMSAGEELHFYSLYFHFGCDRHG